MDYTPDREEERLYFSIIGNDIISFKNVLDEGANVNTRFYGMNQWNKSLLHLSVETGNVECTTLLLECGCQSNIKDAWLQTPLMYAVNTERSNMVELLLQKKCNVNITDRFSNSALHFSIANNSLECMRLLIQYDADVDIKEHNGKTPLRVAVGQEGKVDVVQCLMDAGCDIDIPDDKNKWTPLQAAIRIPTKDSSRYIDMLLKAGASTDTVDVYGHTPLMSVIKMGWKDGPHVSNEHLQLAKIILQGSQNLDLIYEKKQWAHNRGTALNMATQRGALPYVKLLLQAGADPNVQESGYNKVSPLLTAALYGHRQIAKLLLYSNCCPDLQGQVKVQDNYQWLTPFKCALVLGHHDLVTLIVLAGYDLVKEEYLWTNENVPPQLVLNIDLWSWLVDVIHVRTHEPKSLLHTCRDFLRKFFGLHPEVKVLQLPLPVRMKNMVLMRDLLGGYDEEDN